jgi:hypothetical protein
MHRESKTISLSQTCFEGEKNDKNTILSVYLVYQWYNATFKKLALLCSWNVFM